MGRLKVVGGDGDRRIQDLARVRPDPGGLRQGGSAEVWEPRCLAGLLDSRRRGVEGRSRKGLPGDGTVMAGVGGGGGWEGEEMEGEEAEEEEGCHRDDEEAAV